MVTSGLNVTGWTLVACFILMKLLELAQVTHHSPRAEPAPSLTVEQKKIDQTQELHVVFYNVSKSRFYFIIVKSDWVTCLLTRRYSSVSHTTQLPVWCCHLSLTLTASLYSAQRFILYKLSPSSSDQIKISHFFILLICRASTFVKIDNLCGTWMTLQSVFTTCPWVSRFCICASKHHLHCSETGINQYSD